MVGCRMVGRKGSNGERFRTSVRSGIGDYGINFRFSNFIYCLKALPVLRLNIATYTSTTNIADLIALLCLILIETRSVF
jgi:hypothetical protein